MVLTRMRVFMRVLVRVFTGNFMLMLVPMVTPMRVFVGMCMSVALLVCCLRPMRVMSIFMRMGRIAAVRMLRRRTIAGQHIHLGSRDTAAAHLAHLEARTHIQRGSRLLKQAERSAGIHKGAKQHVAADAGKALQISNAHRSRILNGWLGAAPHENLRGKDYIH